jgi:hypothetical protein
MNPPKSHPASQTRPKRARSPLGSGLAKLLAPLLFLLFPFLAGWSARAGDVDGRRFSLISWFDAISDLKYLDADGAVTAAEISLNRFSPDYDYTGPGPIIFGRGTGKPDGNRGFKQLASVPLSKPGSNHLWILFTKLDAVGQYQTFTIEESDSDLPPGAYRFFNFSDNPIHIKCGDWEMIAPPRQSVSFQPNPTDNQQIIPVEIMAELKDGLKRVYSNRWPYGKTTRTLVLAFLDPTTQSYELKRFAQDSLESSATPTKSPKSKPSKGQ